MLREKMEMEWQSEFGNVQKMIQFPKIIIWRHNRLLPHKKLRHRRGDEKIDVR